MTKEQPTTTIPEELYNLTQLAEVTLAAGRLSTTNITEIKDYINKTKPMERHDDEEIQNHMKPDGRLVTKAEQHQQDDVNMIKCEINNSMWTSSSGSTADLLEPIIKTEAFHNNNKNGRINSLTTTKEATENASASATFYSSSDDDSNYYSHKVFDRKKLRRSTVSDNSRYDEHSCSSIPSCSGDEHYGTASASGSISDKVNISDSGSSSMSLTDDEHICPECGKKYSTSSNLARHRQTHRSIMDKKARRCPYCEKVYVSMPAFSMHVRTHNQGCECKYCGKCFSRPWLLQGHIRTHTGEKPFKCNVCNKAFADKSNLRAHIQTHSNTKPHTCARCGKAFALKSYLYKHEESSCMKNQHRVEREPRPGRQSAANVRKSPVTQSTIGTTTTDTAKSTLATKLLQKEKDRREAALAYTTAATFPGNSSTPSMSGRNLQIINPPIPPMSATNDGTLMPTEKSYTMLTSPMSQEDYERFKRISVIQPNVVVAAQENVTIGAYPDSVSSMHLPVQFYNSKPGGMTTQHTPQDQPVDFSPKNNFTHSSKTSPFELTGNYAIVA